MLAALFTVAPARSAAVFAAGVDAAVAEKHDTRADLRRSVNQRREREPCPRPARAGESAIALE